MKNIDELLHMSEEELHSYGDAMGVPIHILRQVREFPRTVSNKAFFHIISACMNSVCTYEFRKVGWLDDAMIKSFVQFHYRDTTIAYFLTVGQTSVFEQCENIKALQKVDENARQRAYDSVYKESLVEDELYDWEKADSFISSFLIPENSATVVITERNSRFSGATWFEEIQKKIIILAGLGGIGSYTAFLLARMNPTSMFLYDDDVVEAANMSGQLYGSNDVGVYKVDAIAGMIGNFAKYYSAFAIREKYTEECDAHDIMICGFDNMNARKIFFKKWKQHVESKSDEDKKKCLFIDGRLAAETLQVYCLTGDNTEAIENYEQTALFSSSEAEVTVCSYKQTTYMANMIGSVIVNLFTNFVANEVVGAPIRELPYFTTYEGSNMIFKIE